MSIKSNFEYKGSTHNLVEFKIARLFGGKIEGNYNAIFAFVVDGEEFVEEKFLGTIAIGIPWVDANPYPLLYKRMEEIIASGGFIIQEEKVDVPPPPPGPPLRFINEGVEIIEPKKTRKKKVNKDGNAKPTGTK